MPDFMGLFTQLLGVFLEDSSELLSIFGGCLAWRNLLYLTKVIPLYSGSLNPIIVRT